LTEIKFHFNVPDRTDYTCRLLRKATRQGAKVVVTGPVSVLAHFDRALWTFDPIEFLPHVMAHAGQRVPERVRGAPVWLLGDPGDAPHHDVLVNLGQDAPVGFESFGRVIEIVSSDDADRSAARQRWKHYAARGYAILRHEVGA
jgi:DNA polymerase III subunit chi